MFSSSHPCSAMFSSSHPCSAMFSSSHPCSAMFSSGHPCSAMFSSSHPCPVLPWPKAATALTPPPRPTYWRRRAACTRDYTSVPETIPSRLDVTSNSSNLLLTKQLPKKSYSRRVVPEELPRKNPRRTWVEPEKSDPTGETSSFLSFSSFPSNPHLPSSQTFPIWYNCLSQKTLKRIFFLRSIISTLNK